MNKIKIFGIGATVLLVLLTAVPAVYGETSLPPSSAGIEEATITEAIAIMNEETNSVKKEIIPDRETTYGPSGDSVDWVQFQAILLQYQEDINEINQYCDDYIAENGYIDENFELPPDLQVKFDNIIDALEEAIDGENVSGQPQPLGGGETKIEVKFMFGILGPAWKYWIYLDDNWTNYLVDFGPWGIAGVAIILVVASAGKLITLAWILASLLIDVGLVIIDDINQGNGIIIIFVDWMFLGYPFDYIEDIRPQ